jgi:hypothetical protein
MTWCTPSQKVWAHPKTQVFLKTHHNHPILHPLTAAHHWVMQESAPTGRNLFILQRKFFDFRQEHQELRNDLR